ncbi:MAG: type II toxin-antitoxin system HicB family antitoxin [Candidatus Scalindua sp.]|nr:type II toxin-antitoxin system HicB family antitoxin [Candidatus Scalindua sp.]MDR4503823.1 type II toxin-antitoxin system HicB family antitoxin [Candidatus Scalindua sp.]
MIRNFSLEYWIDDNWYVGRLKEIPGVFSQGETIEELEENIKDAYHMMMEDEVIQPNKDVKIKEIGVDV